MSKTETGKTTEQESASEDLAKAKVKATFIEGVLRPAEKLNLKEGEEVEIEITKKKGKMFGALKHWKADSQKLKEELRSIHG